MLHSYRVKVIGNPSTITTALKIPGGIFDVLKAAGAITGIREFTDLEITATVSARPLVNAEIVD